MAEMQRVTRINYMNEEFELGDYSVDDVLSSLDIDRSKIDLEERDETLYIMAKTGTKGNI